MSGRQRRTTKSRNKTHFSQKKREVGHPAGKMPALLKLPSDPEGYRNHAGGNSTGIRIVIAGFGEKVQALAADAALKSQTSTAADSVAGDRSDHLVGGHK